MNKAPAFQFYASDFLVDTAEMTNQEVGAYIRLLSHQWVNGGLNGDPNRLANAVGIGLLEVWDDIKYKFELCDDGKYRNPKLEKVRKSQLAYRNKQSEAGKKGAAKRWDGNPISNPISKNIALRSSSSSSKDQNPLSLAAPPTCKHVEVIEIYHEALPELPKIVMQRYKGSAKETNLKARWKEDEAHQNLDFWKTFFGVVRTNPHWMGENDRGWKANFEFLTKRKNFDNVIERGMG